MEMCSKMTNSYNLNAHYTSNPKVEINQKMIVSAPNNLPARKHLFNDKDANNRMKMLNEVLGNEMALNAFKKANSIIKKSNKKIKQTLLNIFQ